MKKACIPNLLEIHTLPKFTLVRQLMLPYGDALQQADQINFSTYLLLLQCSIEVH
jgi:hypothetical protein